MTKQDIIDKIKGIKKDLEWYLWSGNPEDYEDGIDDTVLRLDDLKEKIKAENE